MIAEDRGKKSANRIRTQESSFDFRHVLGLISCILCLMFCLMLINTSVSLAQSFGKNKVSDRHFEWMTYKTRHFIIHYYPDAERLVRTMADMAEIGYAKISSILEHSIDKPTPLILYKSHADFQQTNVILEPLGEGVGGFAELFKYRIVIPFTGSMDEFQKVITHEVTHIFQYDILYKNLFAHIYTGEFLRSPPLWFLEGMAEYMADHWDSQGRMVLRDAVITNSIVPLSYLQDFSPLGSRVYLGYKEGQSAVEYLAEKYGTDKLPEILQELKASRTKDMDTALQNSIGIGLEKFDEEWQETIKKRYWPEIADKQNPDSLGSDLTEKNSKFYYNTKPEWSPSGELIAYITYDTGYEEIVVVSAKDGKSFSKITERFSGDQYDSIRDKGHGLAWSSDGDKIAFIGIRKGKDYLFVVNSITGELVTKLKMPFDAAYSPTWSPDNEQIGIIGVKDGRSDIYTLRLKGAEMTKLTSDIHDESSLSWNPSEPTIVYSSERDGRYKIFTLDLDTRQSHQITYGSQNDISPSWSPDGMKIVFCSDMNGTDDMYTISTDGKSLSRLTNVLTGCSDPVFSPAGDSIALVVYYEGRNDIHILNSKEFLNEQIAPSQEEVHKPLYVVDDRGVRGVKYSLNFAPDLVYADFGYTSTGGIQNTLQVIASDMMGDHRFMAGMDLASVSSNRVDLLVSYYYLKKRTDFGVAMFNWNDFLIEGGESFWQRSTGIAGFASYPIDQFNRIDLRLERYSRFLEYFDEEEERSERNSLTLFGLSLVRDVVIWSNFGPYSGMRVNFSLEQAVKMTGRDLRMTNAIMDYRKYYKLGKRSNFAVRAMGAASVGPDKELFSLGSTFRQSQGGFYFAKTLMRGYESEFLSGSRVGLLNLELRLPFVDELRFGWPFVWGLVGVRGVLFMDFAGFWPRPEGAEDIHGELITLDKYQFKPWIKDGSGFRLVDIRSSIGAGFRIGLGLFSLSFDFAKQTDFRNLGSGYIFHFGLGQEF